MFPETHQEIAELRSPKSGRHGGKAFPTRGTLRGHPGEWFRIEARGRDNYRVARISPEGLAESTSYLVRAEVFTETSRRMDIPAAISPDVSLVGQRGAIIIAARLRNRLGIHEGTVVIQEEREGGVWIRPARVSPRTSEHVADQKVQATLAELLAKITPENLHEEIDFGPPVGKELL